MYPAAFLSISLLRGCLESWEMSGDIQGRLTEMLFATGSGRSHSLQGSVIF